MNGRCALPNQKMKGLKHSVPQERFTREMALAASNPYIDVRMAQPTDGGSGAFEEGARPSGAGAYQKLTFYYANVPWSYSI
jgi:hypothetical protein